MKEFIKHKNLRNAFEDFEKEPEELTAEDIDKVMKELIHSTLLIAGDVDPKGSITFRGFEFEGDNYGLLYTDMNEFSKVFSNDECGAVPFEFPFYKKMVDDGGVGGFVINSASEFFLLGPEVMGLFGDLPLIRFPDDDSYAGEELKNIRDSMDNEKLEDFIKNPENIGKYDELFEMISDSTMMTLRVSDDDLAEHAKDGMISMVETGPMGFLHTDKIGGEYATVYTSEREMADVQTSRANRYSQIVNFAQMANSVLTDDLDGIIINPSSQNVLITRDVLLDYFSFVEKNCNDSRLNTGIMHMFLIEEGV